MTAISNGRYSRIAQQVARGDGSHGDYPMSKTGDVPTPAVRRLSLYLRQLEILHDRGERTISSRQIGDSLGINNAQVRKDLAYFGQFGYPGIGYRVDELVVRIRRILGTDKRWNVLLVGAGNLGRALVRYRGFGKKGFHIVAVFDTDEELVGKTVDPSRRIVVQPVRAMAAAVKKLNIQLGILAVPADAAQQVADDILAAGVRGILNFAPAALHTTGGAVAGVDLAVHLEQLSFRLSCDAPQA